MGKKYTTDEIEVGGHMLNASMMGSLNTVVTNSPSYLTSNPSGSIHMSNGQYVTFYGNTGSSAAHHSIGGVDSNGNPSDDIRINSYHNVLINLDSNNNNTDSTTSFIIGQHGGTNTVSDQFFIVRSDGRVGINNISPSEALDVTGKIVASVDIKAPIFYDSNNTNYYVNPAGTSRLGYAHFDGYSDTSGNARTTTGVSLGRYTSEYAHIDIASSHGSGGWIDFSDASGGDYGGRIRYYNSSGFMSFYAGGNNEEFRINPSYTTSLGSSRAPVFYDNDNTGYYLNPASTSVLNSINILGSSTTTGYMELNHGVRPTYVSMSYGQGGSDDVLFDSTNYFTNAQVRNGAPNESTLTSNSSEYTTSSDAPFAGGHVIETDQNRNFYSNYIPVTPGETLEGEIYQKVISGTNNRNVYYGIERFDSDKRPIHGNTGTTYFVAGGTIQSSSSWKKWYGKTIIPTTHTPYGGSNGGGVHWVRIRILLNYSSTSTAVSQFGGWSLKRIQSESRASTALYAPKFYDSNDTNYYVDPASASNLNALTISGSTVATQSWVTSNANSSNANLLDSLNSTQFLRSDANDSFTGNLTTGAANHITFGPNSTWQSSLRIGGNGHTATGTYMASVVTTNGNLHLDSAVNGGRAMYLNFYAGTGGVNFGDGAQSITANITSTGILYANQVRVPIFYDSDDTNYYVNPNARSRFNEIQTPDSGATPRYDTAFYVIQGQHWYGDTSSQVMYLGESSNPVRLRGSLRIGGTGNADSGMSLTVAGSANATSSLRAPIFYDSNDTNYYVNPASTTSINVAGQIRGASVRVTNIITNKIVKFDGSVLSNSIMSDNGSTISVSGNVEHQGLTMTEGTDVDQVKTFALSLTPTTDWMDTGINYNDLGDGTYAVQCFINNSTHSSYSMRYSGMMSWFGSGSTNDSSADEIHMHRAGHAPNQEFSFRTLHQASSVGTHLKFQIKSSAVESAAATYTFKFRRLI